MIWYLQDPERFRSEREALDALAAEAAWLSPIAWRVDERLRLIWDADIIAPARSYPVSLRYPSHFPYSPPLVLPRDASDERWSAHQWGVGGELCLEWGPDNWHKDVTGAEMMQSAYRLLEGESPAPGVRGVVSSRHTMTLGQTTVGEPFRLVAPYTLVEALQALPPGRQTTGMLAVTFREETAVFVFDEVDLLDGAKWTDDTVPAILAKEGYRLKAMIKRLEDGEPLPPATSFAALKATFQDADADYFLVVRGTELYAYTSGWKDDRVIRITILPTGAGGPRLNSGHAALAECSVAIVGCGSLGGKVAVMLARCGVGRFLLIDDDILFPGNLVRNDLDWREVGKHKVDAVALRIRLVNARVSCERRRHRVGGQHSSGEVEDIIEGIAKCDLVIDATSDPLVFNYLTAACTIGKKPMLWTEIFAGGIGGFMARSRPGIEPDPQAIRNIIESWCLSQGKPIERAAGGYETQQNGVPLIADDTEVSVIAAHAARFAIDMLLQRSPSAYPHAVYMIGLADDWIFDQPFDTKPIDVGQPVAAADAQPAKTMSDQDRAFILQLFQKFSNADSPDTGSDRAAAE